MELVKLSETRRTRGPSPRANFCQGYHRFIAEDGEAYGSFEVFYMVPEDEGKAGWYWASSLPGCMWDADPTGPFHTSEAAMRDARAL